MGAYTELVDFTFTANETSRTFSGLNITKDDFIKVVMTLTTGGTNVTVRMFPNANTTDTNYYRQSLSGFGSGVGAGRSNNNVFLSHNGVGGSTATIGYIKISENNRYNVFTNNHGSTTSSGDLNTAFIYTTQSGGTDTTSITSLTFTASVASAINTGSRIQIYRLDAEKVADITTTANATEVDISNLSIGKDNEYLLIGDLKLTSGPNYVGLYVNGDRTNTNYYHQRVRGDGSTAGAVRANNPEYTGGGTGNSLNNLVYSHIKLSEIGAYTSQNYQLRFMGTSTPVITNSFESSTAENITSITQLNIGGVGGVTIETGSRFILYKLK
jgi:hypothetical protein